MVTENGADLVARVLDDLSRIGAVIVARIAAEVPSFRSLPADVLQVEIRSAVDQTFALVMRSLVDGTELDADRLSRPLRQVMVRVEDRPSFEDILRAYFIGVRVGWERLIARAEPHELATLPMLIGPLTEQLQALFVAAAHAYLDDQARVQGEVGEARRELADALLAGQSARALARRAGVRADSAYTLLTWRLMSESGTPLSRRRIRAELDDSFGRIVLSILDERGGIALVPGDPVERGLLERFESRLTALVGVSVMASSRADTCPEVPAAAGEASEVLDVVHRLGYPPGLYLLDDVLLEVQLARPGPANERLANRLAPLEDRPELLTTLQTFVDVGLGRRRASSRLHVHPNTLDYRLHRIAEFTGLDPTRATDIRVLAAALTVRALRLASPRG